MSNSLVAEVHMDNVFVAWLCLLRLLTKVLSIPDTLTKFTGHVESCQALGSIET